MCPSQASNEHRTGSSSQGRRYLTMLLCPEWPREKTDDFWSVNQPAEGWWFYIDFSSGCWWIQRAASWILQTPSVLCLHKAWKKTHLGHFSSQKPLPLKVWPATNFIYNWKENGVGPGDWGGGSPFSSPCRHNPLQGKTSVHLPHQTEPLPLTRIINPPSLSFIKPWISKG